MCRAAADVDLPSGRLRSAFSGAILGSTPHSLPLSRDYFTLSPKVRENRFNPPGDSPIDDPGLFQPIYSPLKLLKSTFKDLDIPLHIAKASRQVGGIAQITATHGQVEQPLFSIAAGRNIKVTG